MTDTQTSFVHLTDLHIGTGSGNGATADGEDAARLRAVLDAVRATPRAPAFIAISGDLADRGDEDSYRRLAECLEGVDPPIVMTLGNHDARAPFRAVFSNRFDGLEGDDPQLPVCQDLLAGGLHVIAIDTLVPGRIGGAIGPEALGFLDAALARHEAHPKVLVMHHPPQRRRAERDQWDSLTARSTAALAERVRRHKVAAILCGHVHMDQAAMWNGALLVTNTGLQNTIDLTRADMLHVVEGAGYAWCAWRDGGAEALFAAIRPERKSLRRISWERLAGA